MVEADITIPVTLDAKTFRRFARFDMLKLRRRWVRPLVFALILIGFAAVALMLRREQSGLLAAVLLTVGLGLPLVYIGTFLSQTNMQAMRQKLDKPRLVYTVSLREEGLRVTGNRKDRAETLELPWDKIYGLYGTRRCLYLYVTAGKAFLLPDGQGNASRADIIAFLGKKLPPEKIHVKN